MYIYIKSLSAFFTSSNLVLSPLGSYCIAIIINLPNVIYFSVPLQAVVGKGPVMVSISLVSSILLNVVHDKDS